MLRWYGLDAGRDQCSNNHQQASKSVIDGHVDITFRPCGWPARYLDLTLFDIYALVRENKLQNRRIFGMTEVSTFCADNMFPLRQLIEKPVERNLATHLVFVDLKKAYDSVPLKLLF